MKPSSIEARRALITEGPILGALIELAWPTMTSSVLHGLVGFVDVYMVGRLGASAVAAVSMGNTVLMLVMVTGAAFGNGTTALVARFIGAQEWDQARRVVNQAYLGGLLLACGVLAPLGFLSAPTLLGWLGAQPEVTRLALGYMRLLFLGAPFGLLGFLVGAALRGAGDTRTPLYIGMFTNTLNIVLNYGLIFGAWGLPQLGVMGAAWGTLLARLAAVAIGTLLLASGRLAIGFHARGWGWNGGLQWRILRIGLPTSLDAVALNLFGAVLHGLLARTAHPTAAQAAYGVGMQVRTIATWVSWGLGAATMTMVGQNLGALRPHRAVKSGWAASLLSVAWMGTLGVIYFLAAPWLIALFVKDPEPAVITIGVQFLRVSAFALPVLGVGMALTGALRGAGDTVTPLYINLFALFGAGLPTCWLLGFPLTLDTLGIWLGFALAMVLRGVLSAAVFARGRWQHQTV